ncbi:lipopolysaccharide heptosyltransferase II [Francisella frigiditurris]|uniref:lipopolysaccharide heptosyltransferase II n=1 Tax=Francisella frigiditurris TaxID=1542390 RepID=A0A1J0KU78_9GAMM|nr:lipopolysaccharide heptosyltransferase II [Francisella frigiditurris]APC97243.1 lipopolysaccharide heptosyltransferase II [Francisella frigiditurris]
MLKSKKILVIAPNWIGDMVGAQSLLISLKKNDPDCIIDVAGPKPCLELTKFMPEVNETFVLDLKHGQVSFKTRLKEAKEIKKKGYDQCIILPNSLKSAIIPFLARIKKRTGWLGEQRYILLNDHRKLDKKAFPLMVDRYNALAFAKNITPSNTPLPKLVASQKDIENVVKKLNIDTSRSTIALCPGAAYGPSKQWPAKYHAEVAKALINDGYLVFILGSPADIEIAKEIEINVKNNNLINFTGTTSMAEAISILATTSFCLGNDSGLSHISWALGKTTFITYGSSEIIAPPDSENAIKLFVDNLVCRPCKKRVCPLGHFKCMMDLTPDMVLKTIYQKIQN